VDDPWRVYLTTDHPNGGPFISYPYIIRMLMDKDFRKEQISKISAEASTEIPLKVLEREYTLDEIAIITRAGTAKRLGLVDKGHLGEGADADVTIYRKSNNYEEMFATPAYVIKDGEIVVKDGKLVKQVFGKTLYVKPETGAADIQSDLENFFHDYYTINIANYPVGLEYLPNSKLVECVK
jgi:formylmethanofuran dehydrogenase subunit A